LASRYRNVAIASLLVACATGRTSTPTVPTAASGPIQSDSASIMSTKSTAWNPHIVPLQLHYVVDDSSTVLISNDTSARTNSIEAHTVYTVSIIDTSSTSSQYFLTVRVDSQSINNRPSKSRKDSVGELETRVGLTKEGKIVQNLSNVPPSCSSSSATSLARIHEIRVTLPPPHAKIGERWADTTSSIICRGKIPLMQKTTYEYELLSLTTCAQHNGVSIRRIATSNFSTSPVDSTSHLTANGSGTSTAILCLNRDDSALLESVGQSRIDLTVITSRGTFPFTQNSTTHIRLQ
jgi:hypothetical protein